MSITRVKICGITRPEDAALAAELGADAIGLNFVGGPRQITPDQARTILNAVDYEFPNEPIPRLQHGPVPVALCHAPARETYPDIWPMQLGGLPFARFQVYGADTQQLLEELSRNFDYQFWPVIRVATEDDIYQVEETKRFNWPVYAVVLDTSVDGVMGGTGKSFNWSWLAEQWEHDWPKLILAGGLSPGNVADAIRIAKPYAVDVSTGVEVAGKPGIKDPIKMRDFIQAAKAAAQ